MDLLSMKGTYLNGVSSETKARRRIVFRKKQDKEEENFPAFSKRKLRGEEKICKSPMMRNRAGMA